MGISITSGKKHPPRPLERLRCNSSSPRRRALYLVWCRAGIQSVGDNNNFKGLDSRSPLTICGDRFRGNDALLPITTQSPRGEGRKEGKFLFPDHLGTTARAIHLEAGNPGLMGGSRPALGADAFSPRAGAGPHSARSTSAPAASRSSSSSGSPPASRRRSRSVSSGHIELLSQKGP